MNNRDFLEFKNHDVFVIMWVVVALVFAFGVSGEATQFHFNFDAFDVIVIGFWVVMGVAMLYRLNLRNAS